MPADKIPDEIMREAMALVGFIPSRFTKANKPFAISTVARALMARDTAARKECAEIARSHDDGGVLGIAAGDIVIAIEATIGERP